MVKKNDNVWYVFGSVVIFTMILLSFNFISAEEVECTNNAICIQKYGKNYVCDLSPNNFGSCKYNSEFIGYCGDGKCEDVIGETATSCPEDCDPNYQSQQTSSNGNNSILIGVIVGVAIIIGFIILASKKKK